MAKSKYETHVLPNLEKVEAWARAGATAKDISAKLNIAYSTFRNYVDLGQQGDDIRRQRSAIVVCKVIDMRHGHSPHFNFIIFCIMI